jgi:hypothetical protein
MIQEPVPPTLDPGRPARGSGGGGRHRGLIALVAIACLALAVPLVGVAIAATAQPTTSATGASPAPASSVKPKTDQGQGHGPKADKGPKGNADAGKGNSSISVTAIDGSKVSLKTVDGWTRTITVGATTVITRGAKTISVGDLKVGDPVRFHQIRNADGTYAISAINVVIPHLGGVVTAKTSDSITVMRNDGSLATIHVTGTTTYGVKGKASAALADVAVGSRVIAEGSFRADGSLDAVSVGSKAAKGSHPDDDQGDDDGATPSAAPTPS